MISLVFSFGFKASKIRPRSGSGSDLASLKTKAEDKGDHFVVNGQKVWTSYADDCDMIFTLVRTGPQEPKHDGISFLLIDMDQPWLIHINKKKTYTVVFRFLWTSSD